MKVAYIFQSEKSREILENMIVPQLETGSHGADVVGMFFFFDNTYILHKDSSLANRLAAISEKTGMMLMACDYCCNQRDIADKLVMPAGIGCFPNLYCAMEGAAPDQVITL